MKQIAIKSKSHVDSSSCESTFTEEYLARLRDGDPETQRHFAWYFGTLVRIKAQNRLRSPELIEEVRQETLLRALLRLRRDVMIGPDSLGKLVNSTCNEVLGDAIYRDSGADREPRLPAPDATIVRRILKSVHDHTYALLWRPERHLERVGKTAQSA